jgi:hypothetical protein
MATNPRKPATTSGKSRSASSRSTRADGSGSTKAATRSKPAARKRSTASRSASSQSKASGSTSPQSTASSNGAGNGGVRKVLSQAKVPLVAGGAAAVGVLGGVAIGAKALPRKRRFGLGGHKLDLNKVSKQVGRAGTQFGDLTEKLRKAGEQAEKVGKTFS